MICIRPTGTLVDYFRPDLPVAKTIPEDNLRYLPTRRGRLIKYCSPIIPRAGGLRCSTQSGYLKMLLGHRSLPLFTCYKENHPCPI